jgi:hypothetical protein
LREKNKQLFNINLNKNCVLYFNNDSSTRRSQIKLDTNVIFKLNLFVLSGVAKISLKFNLI